MIGAAMKRKILYIEGCRDGTVGGSHTCLYSLVVNLDKKKYQPEVVFYQEHYYAEKLRGFGITVHILKNVRPVNFEIFFKKKNIQNKILIQSLLPLQKLLNFYIFVRQSFILSRCIKKRNVNIDHLNNSMNTNHDWMLAAKIAGVKLISHERGITDHLSRTAALLVNKVDYFVCMSKIISKPIIKNENLMNKTAVVYDGIDISKINITTDPNNIKLLYGIEDNNPIIGVIGNIKQWKGQETVVRATSILKKRWSSIRCMLVGDYNDKDFYKINLDKIIKELEINGNIIFTGFQSNPLDFINVMDVVVHASLQPEPFGMVNLEAMCMKKAIISTNIGGPVEIFNDGNDGILIEPGNPDLLANKLALLLDNPELRKNMGDKSYKKVMGKFTIKETVNRIDEIYDDVCG